MMHAKWWTALVPVVACAACAGAPVPAQRLASAEAAARGATEVGAEGTPQAALHLKMAHDQIAEARGLIQRGENERAGFVLARAEADAELALTLSRESAARAAASAALAQAQALRQQSP